MTRLLAMGIGARLFTDTSIQIFGPYLPVIAAGLGVSIITLGALNSVRSLMGLAAPAFGSAADRFGYRRTMRLILLLGGSGSLLLAASWNRWMVGASMILMGLGVFCFAPVMQAYMSAQIPYHRRARGLGMVEYAWALAGIGGLSLSGLLIDRFGWRAPFWLLGFGLLGACLVFGFLPVASQQRSPVTQKRGGKPWRHWPARLRSLVTLPENRRSAWAAIGANAFSIFAIANVNIAYGTWLVREYELSTIGLGLVALVLGLAELAGSLLVSLAGDRLGIYRTLRGSTGATVAAYALLPLLNFHWLAVIAGLVLAHFVFEVSIVSNISLLSEQVPAQRGKVLTLAAAAVTLMAAIASVTGPFTFSSWGASGLGLLATGAALGALALLLGWVQESG